MKSKGSVIILAAFAMVIIMILGTGLIAISGQEFLMANNYADRIKAYYLAEAGMQKALAMIANDANFLERLNINGTVADGEDPFAGITAPRDHGSFSNVILKAKEQVGETITAILAVTGRCNDAVCCLEVKVEVRREIVNGEEIVPASVHLIYWRG